MWNRKYKLLIWFACLQNTNHLWYLVAIVHICWISYSINISTKWDNSNTFTKFAGVAFAAIFHVISLCQFLHKNGGPLLDQYVKVMAASTKITYPSTIYQVTGLHIRWTTIYKCIMNFWNIQWTKMFCVKFQSLLYKSDPLDYYPISTKTTKTQLGTTGFVLLSST